MLSTMVGHRLHLVRRWPYGESVTGDEVVEILLDSLIPILINYEREGMTEGQENLKLCGVSGIRICDFLTRDDSNLVELSFMDRLAKARDELWKTHRARTDPNVLELRAGWPRGLPVQNLVDSPIWLLHAMKYQDHAPFLSVRANQLLFSTVDVIMDVVTKEGDCIHGFVDDLGFVIQALLANPHQATRICDVRRVWEYYSQILGPHPVYLGLFKEWLVNILPNQDEMAEAINMIQQPSLSVKPMVSAVPTGSEVIEWDPHEGDYPLSETTLDDDKGIRTERPHEILCTILNYRMGG
ncbi:hypothetical protein N7533_013056 [Penicillium manginii]|uniref:uncharacterized protein n=1 Tax=Penicillium manginii TaxID=203109 RepID=UPI002548B786|nr:uncharacterized protein N7533_013056 [Penicillium manginii]KAJ5734653.1 hypothetical protein N7533_013056 [Penicillium manginii]